jgi:Cu+-exporting ATPase
MSDCCHKQTANTEQAATQVLKDPVCGMTVQPDSPLHHKHHGTTYYFCGNGCLKKFSANPQAYLGEKPPAPVEIPGAEYTCPMHPEIVQDRFWHLPKMRHGLGADDAECRGGRKSPELHDFRRRFWYTLPLHVSRHNALAMSGHAGVSGSRLGVQPWVELVLSAPVVLWAGWPFFQRAVEFAVPSQPEYVDADRHRHGCGLSLQRGRPRLRRSGFLRASTMHGQVGVYFEAAVVIISLTLLGQLLELKARSATSAAIRALLGLAPKTARRLNNDGSGARCAAGGSAAR